MREWVNKENWQPILDALNKTVESFPYCREREMARFYLEELKYRFWHYCLGLSCMATDLDFIEYRFVGSNQIRRVGFIEIKSEKTAAIRPRTNRQEEILLQLATDARTPLWRVTFRDDLSEFLVEQKYPTQVVNHFNEDEYKASVQNLGKMCYERGEEQTQP